MEGLAKREFVRQALIEIREDRSRFRRRIEDYYGDSAVLPPFFDWDVDNWDQFVWGP